MYFQYIESLYKDSDDYESIVKNVEEWLNTNVGKQGSARHPYQDFDWGWSLTAVSAADYHTPSGIYFAKEEDQTLFRLSFGIGRGNERDK